MRSKNKPPQTAAEKRHVEKVAQLPCVVCENTEGIEVHEPEQGFWMVCLPLCFDCHRGSHGWHGDRLRWSLNKMNELKAINATLRSILI